MEAESSFLGTGWSFPPEFGRFGGNVKMITGEQDIFQSLEILLATSLGERIMHPDFGCDLSRFVFGEIDQSLTNGIKSAITDAFLKHEPRIKVNEIDISESEAEPGVLLISVDYTIRTTNSRYNMVYPFYINEAMEPEFKKL